MATNLSGCLKRDEGSEFGVFVSISVVEGQQGLRGRLRGLEQKKSALEIADELVRLEPSSVQKTSLWEAVHTPISLNSHSEPTRIFLRAAMLAELAAVWRPLPGLATVEGSRTEERTSALGIEGVWPTR